MRRFRIAAMLAFGLTLVLVAQAAATTTWTVVPSPSPGTGVFNALLASVSAISASDAWAVGIDNSPCAHAPSTGAAMTAAAACDDHTLAEHWDGSSWTAVPTPNRPGGGNDFNAVAAIAPDDVWAVGSSDNANHGTTRTLAEHWDGSAWTIVRTKNDSTAFGAANVFTSVVAIGPTKVWAGGYAIIDGGGGIEMLFERWNGTRWHKVPSPTPPGSFQFVTGMSVVSGRDIWAVGYDAGGSASRNVSAHWDGTAWTLVPTPNIAGGTPADNKLEAVAAVAADDVWAVGWENNIDGLNKQQTIAMRWDGSVWTVVPTPNPNTSGGELFGATAISSTDVWAIGESRNFDTGEQHSLTMQWDGTAWTEVPSPNGSVTTTLLGADALPGGTAWSVGSTEVPGECCLRTFVVQSANA
jgi:hypothetical protein